MIFARGLIINCDESVYVYSIVDFDFGEIANILSEFFNWSISSAILTFIVPPEVISLTLSNTRLIS